MSLNEFRQDLVSGDWVLLVTGRTHSLRKDEVPNGSYQPIETCPFEDGNISEQYTIWKYPDNKDWFATVIRNKYPAVTGNGSTMVEQKTYGPFNTFDAIGEHDVIVYRQHDHGIYDFSQEDFINMTRVYKKRYTELAEKSESAKYILIFHNHGKEAGASIYHTHSQIITTPILPPDVFRSIHGSFKYYQEHKKKVYDELLEWEQKERTRVVYENDKFIVFCPYISKHPYEVRIFSKEGHAHFQQMPDELDKFFADALHTAIQKIKIALGKPSFNMFVHTAPAINLFGVSTHEFYHWHLEIIPHLKIDAGFEIGTGVEINVVNPDEAADALRRASI